MRRDPVNVVALFNLGLLQIMMGRLEAAGSDAALAALIGKYDKDGPYNIAYVHAFRGEADAAFAWLDKAVEYGDAGLSEIVSESMFKNIRTDPRWLPFVRKIGKAPEQLAKTDFKVTLQKEGVMTSGDASTRR